MKKILVLSLWLAGCTAAPTPIIIESDESTPIPIATATIAIATPNASPKISIAIPSPSLVVPAIPSPTRAPLLAALNKTLAAKIYRVTMTLNVKIGNAPAFVLNLQSVQNGDDAQIAYQLGAENIELIEVGGQHFVKGARALGVPSLSKWYSITPDLADAVRHPFAPEEILAAIAATELKQNFSASAREILDGINCAVWSYRPGSLADAGIGRALGLDAPNNAFESVEQAEMKMWLCDDGALHQLMIDVAAHKVASITEKGNL
ncbi:MAG: hypothetical protein HY070_05915, partial [Chloroflexi bacterium]|nr:hypothetical protein [Chloroflexota bacterium]